MMRSVLRLLLPFVLLLSPIWGQQWSMGYWLPWGNPPVPISEIQWDGLTHVVQWGALVRADGTLDLTTNNFTKNAPEFIAAAQGANIKVLLGLTQPYWLGQTTNFQQAVSAHRNVLVSQIMSLVNTYGFDGVDIDWEPFNGSTNGAAMSSLVTSLRAELGPRILTVAAIVTDYKYWGSLAGQLDRVNVMTYDMSGLWDPFSWHNSALHSDSDMVWSIDLAVRRYTDGGVPRNKLGIGIPFFGWRWSGGGVSGPRQTWSSSPSLSQIYYHNFSSEITADSYRWDSVANVPYLAANGGFLSYDNEQSVADKVRYAKSQGLGGWIIWSLEGDYLPNANPKHPLITAIRDAMGPSQVKPSITSLSQLPEAPQNEFYSQSLTSTGANPLTWNIVGGALPAGLGLDSATGVISGEPQTLGVFSFVVEVSNAAGTDRENFSLKVNSPSTAPSVVTASPLPDATREKSYSATLHATGSNPITWRLIEGALPAGLQVDSSTGVIAGSPRETGTFLFSVEAKNAAGTDVKSFRLTVSGTAKLSIEIVSPANQRLPFRPLTLRVAVSDSVVEVRYRLNGETFVVASDPPFAYHWDLSKLRRRTWFTLDAVGKDTTGRTVVSAPKWIRFR